MRLYFLGLALGIGLGFLLGVAYAKDFNERQKDKEPTDTKQSEQK